jgi:hypothetical protein
MADEDSVLEEAVDNLNEAGQSLRATKSLVFVLRNKAIRKDTANFQGAVGRDLDREPEHFVDLVAFLGA